MLEPFLNMSSCAFSRVFCGGLQGGKCCCVMSSLVITSLDPQDSQKPPFFDKNYFASSGVWCCCGSRVVALKDDECFPLIYPWWFPF